MPGIDLPSDWEFVSALAVLLHIPKKNLATGSEFRAWTVKSEFSSDVFPTC